MIPAMIPMNGFWILSNASVIFGLSTMPGLRIDATPVDRSVVIISIDDGHDEYVEFSYSKGIDKGDVLTVKYLPHSKYGILISINNDNVALE